MKILYTTPRYYPYIGGVEYVVKTLAEKLADRGHQVTVLTGEPCINKPLKENINDVQIIKWPTWAPQSSYHVPRRINKLNIILRDILKEVEIVHIHSIHAFMSTFILKVLGKEKHKAKIVLSPHYLGEPNSLPRKISFKINRYLIIKDLNKVNIVLCSSSCERKMFVKDFKLKDKIEVRILPIPLPSDIRKYEWNPPKNKIVITMSGRMDITQKRYDILLRSAPLIIYKLRKALEKERHVEFKLIGTGPHKAYLKKLIKSLNIEENVRFISPLPREEYLKEISSSTLYVFISEHENYGIAPREAIAIGVPTVVSYNSALAELVNEGLCNGVKNMSIHGIADVITSTIIEVLTGKPEKNRKRGTRMHSNLWNPDYIILRVVDIYSNLM